MTASNPSINVLVLGHGQMGRAMERLLAERARLAIWDKYPGDDFESAMLSAAAPVADVAILCLPTVPHAEVLGQLVPLLRPACICLSVAKGLDEAGNPVYRILEAALGSRFGYGVLHGPMIAEEIQAGSHAFAHLATRGDGVTGRVLALFAGTRLHLTPVPDLPGVNWAVILKNVYALAFGMADELGLGDNVRGWLAATAIREMDEIVQRMGGAPGTAQGLAGLGDLIATATSGHSHHHQLGRRLAQGNPGLRPVDATGGEAVHTLAVIERHGLLDTSGLPLFHWIATVVRDRSAVRSGFEELLNR